MTIAEASKKYHKIELELLLAHVLQKPKEFVFLHEETKLIIKQQREVEKLAKLRLQGRPVAYILGYKDFYGLRFKVNRNVLIPRPETEWLVDRAMTRAALGKAKILDIGTGSGAIAVSLAKELRSRAALEASDISQKALMVAKQNAKNHKVKIKFHHSNLFSNITGKFDIIIANLPYVSTADYRKLRSGLRFEPRGALVAKDNFEIYQDFLKKLPDYTSRGALVLLEMDPKTKKYLQIWQKKYLPTWKISFYKDFNNLWRYAELTRSAAL